MSPSGVTAATGCGWPYAVSGRPAVTHYRVLERFRAHTYLSVKLETGRTHQIRLHLSHIKYPIVGDPVYGGRFGLPRGATPRPHRHPARVQAPGLACRRAGIRSSALGQAVDVCRVRCRRISRNCSALCARMRGTRRGRRACDCAQTGACAVSVSWLEPEWPAPARGPGAVDLSMRRGERGALCVAQLGRPRGGFGRRRWPRIGGAWRRRLGCRRSPRG